MIEFVIFCVTAAMLSIWFGVAVYRFLGRWF